MSELVRRLIQGGGQITLGCCFVAGLMSAALHGQDANVAGKYAAAFEQFQELGVPDLRDKPYVKLSIENESYRPSPDWKASMTGNAWLLWKTEQQAGFWTADGGKLVIDRQDQVAQEPEKRQAKWRGRWEPADLQQDASSLLEQANEFSSSRAQHHVSAMSSLSVLLLYAVSLDAAGQEGDAAVLADLLLKSGEGNAVVESALALLFLQRYEALLTYLESSQNWPQFSDQLSKLLREFNHDSPLHQAVATIAEQAEERWRKPLPRPLRAKQLSKEDQELAKRLAKIDLTEIGPLPEYNWILRSPEEAEPTWGGQLMARGVEALPFLQAMLADDYLLPIRRQSLSPDTPQTAALNRQSLATYQDADYIRQMLDIPVSRGELAARFLISVLDEQGQQDYRDGQLASTSDAERTQLASTVGKLHQTLKEKKPREVAAYYLENGGNADPAEAFRLVLEGADEDEAKKLETLLLEMEEPMRLQQLATIYVSQRGGKAQDFVQQLEPKLLKAYEQSHPHMAPEQVQQLMQPTMEYLQAAATEESLEEVLAKLASEQLDPGEVSALLVHLLRQGTPEEVVSKMVALAADSPDKEAVALLAFVMVLPNYAASFRHLGGSPEIAQAWEAWELNPLEQKEAWLALLEREEKLNPEKGGTVAALATDILVERAPAWKEGMTEVDAVMLGETAKEVYLPRARAYLQGKPVEEWPNFPDKESLSTHDRLKLTDRLQKLSGKAMADWLEMASLHDLLQLHYYLEEANPVQAKPLKQALLSGRNTVHRTTVHHTGKPGEEKRNLDAFVGQEVNLALLDKIADWLRQQVKPGEGLSIAIMRPAGMGVMQLDASKEEGEGLKHRFSGYTSGEGKHQEVAYLVGHFTIEGTGGFFIDRLKPKPKKEPNSDDVLVPEEESGFDPMHVELRKRFEEQLKTALAKTDSLSESILVKLTAYRPKHKTDAEEEDL